MSGVDVIHVMNRLIRSSECDRRMLPLEQFRDMDCRMRDEELEAIAAISDLIDVAKDCRDSLSTANKVYADGALGLLVERLSDVLSRMEISPLSESPK